MRLKRGISPLGSLPYSYRKVAKDLLRAMSHGLDITQPAFEDPVLSVGNSLDKIPAVFFPHSFNLSRPTTNMKNTWSVLGSPYCRMLQPAADNEGLFFQRSSTMCSTHRNDITRNKTYSFNDSARYRLGLAHLSTDGTPNIIGIRRLEFSQHIVKE